MTPIRSLARLLAAILVSRRGATAVEYGLIIALIVVAMFAGLRNVAEVTVNLWTYVTHEVLEHA